MRIYGVAGIGYIADICQTQYHICRNRHYKSAIGVRSRASLLNRNRPYIFALAKRQRKTLQLRNTTKRVPILHQARGKGFLCQRKCRYPSLRHDPPLPLQQRQNNQLGERIRSRIRCNGRFRYRLLAPLQREMGSRCLLRIQQNVELVQQLQRQLGDTNGPRTPKRATPPRPI